MVAGGAVWGYGGSLGDLSFAFQIDGSGLSAGTNLATNLQIILLAIGVDDFQIKHLDGIAADAKFDGLVASFLAPDADHVAISRISHFLRPQQLPRSRPTTWGTLLKNDLSVPW